VGCPCPGDGLILATPPKTSMTINQYICIFKITFITILISRVASDPEIINATHVAIDFKSIVVMKPFLIFLFTLTKQKVYVSFSPFITHPQPSFTTYKKSIAFKVLSQDHQQYITNSQHTYSSKESPKHHFKSSMVLSKIHQYNL
jgi:hypothetical protein